MAGEPAKRCRKCGNPRLLLDFNRDARAPDGRSRWCRPCFREYNRKRTGAKPRRVCTTPEQKAQAKRESNARYRERNREEIQRKNREYAERWRRENPEKVRELARQSNAKESERRRKARAGRICEWCEGPISDDKIASARVCSTRCAAALATYRLPLEQPERYLRKRGGHPGAKAEPVDRIEVYARGGGLCGICREPVDFDRFHVDHIKPIALGGDHTYENTQPAHPDCNRWKGAR